MDVYSNFLLLKIFQREYQITARADFQFTFSEDRTPRQTQYLKSLREELNQRINSGETNLTIKYINRVPQIITKQKN
jgi:hypothetical protein